MVRTRVGIHTNTPRTSHNVFVSIASLRGPASSDKIKV